MIDVNLDNANLDSMERLILRLSQHLDKGYSYLSDGLIDEVHTHAITIQRKTEKKMKKSS